jgi:hypothetical protein
MIVNKLDTMEKIVAKNNNLKWDGWDVLDLKKSDLAKTSVNGVRINNEWFLRKTYKLDSNGWDIPNKYRE